MQFLVENSIYVTLIIALMVLVGVLFYLVKLDSRLRKLEQKEQNG